MTTVMDASQHKIQLLCFDEPFSPSVKDPSRGTDSDDAMPIRAGMSFRSYMFKHEPWRNNPPPKVTENYNITAKNDGPTVVQRYDTCCLRRDGEEENLVPLSSEHTTRQNMCKESYDGKGRR